MSTTQVPRAEQRTSLRVETACEFSAVRAGVSQISAWLNELGLNEADLGAWELALIEGGNNAVKYATPQGKQLPVIFDLTAGAHDIEARITDHTPGFDWPVEIKLPEPDAEHGRGLYLMQSLSDSITYFRQADQNALVLRRSRPFTQRVLPDIGELQRRLTDAETALNDMTAELAANYESLVAVFRYSSDIGAHADIREFSHRLLRDLLQVAEADGLVLRLLSGDGKKLETTVILPEENPPNLPPLSVNGDTEHCIEIRAAQSGVDVWFSPEEPLDKKDPLRAAMPLGNGICHAIFNGGQLLGTAVMGRKAANKPFTAAQINLLHTFVGFLAIQIVNARLVDERTAARVTQRELEIAAEIQRSLLPAQLPACHPYSLAAVCQSALQIGGDFYDMIPAGQNRALLVIADVMGKGVPAALFAAVLRSIIRSMSHLFPQPGELLSAVNKTLYADLSQVNMFITATAVFLDSSRGGLIYASAGHCPLLLCNTGPEKIATAKAGFPLGIEEDTVYKQTVNALPPGGAALLYTDGLSESRSPGGEQLGEARLREKFCEAIAQTRTAETAKSFLLEQLSLFRGDAPVADDQTLILIRHTP